MNIMLYLTCPDLAEQLNEQLQQIFATFRFTDIENLVKTLSIYQDLENTVLIIDKQNKDMIPRKISERCYTIIASESPEPIEDQDVRFNVEISYKDLSSHIMTMLSYYYAMQDLLLKESAKIKLDSKYGDMLYANMLDKLKVFYNEIIQDLSNRESVILCGHTGTGKTYILQTLKMHKFQKFVLINKDILNRDSILSQSMIVNNIPHDFIIGVEGLEDLDEKIQQLILKLAYNKRNTFIITTRLSQIDAINRFPRFTKYFTNIYTLPSVKDYKSSEVLSVLIKWIGDSQIVISKEAQHNVNKYPFYDNFHEVMDLSRYIKRRNVEIVREQDLPIHLCEANKFLATSNIGNNEFLEILNNKIYDLSVIEKAMVKAVLRKNLFNKTRSAEDLGISKDSLNTKIRVHMLTPEEVLRND